MESRFKDFKMKEMLSRILFDFSAQLAKSFQSSSKDFNEISNLELNQFIDTYVKTIFWENDNGER